MDTIILGGGMAGVSLASFMTGTSLNLIRFHFGSDFYME